MSFLFGGGSTPVQSPKINFPGPSGFNTAGGSASYSGGSYNFSPSAAQTSAIGSLQSTFGAQAGALGQLRQSVQPGFSQLRRAGLNQLNTQQQATTSNLRDNLAQRRILGSSFAQSSLSQNDAEFAQQKANFVAQSYLQEVQTSNQLIQEQYQAATQQYSVGINQMNFDTGIAAQLTSQATQASASVAEAQAKLDAQTAQFNATQKANADAGVGKLIGTLGGAAIGAFGGPAGSALGAKIGSSLFDPTPTAADYGGPGIGSGGFNFMDAQAGP